MKKFGRAVGSMALAMLVLLELSGCGSPPPPKSAKNEINEAEQAMEEGASRMHRAEYEEAKTQYEKAIAAINKGLDSCSEMEEMRLKALLKDAISQKTESDLNVRKKAAAPVAKAKPATTATAPVAQADPEAEKRAAEKAKAAAANEANKGALSAIGTPKAAKKADEPEDVGDVAAGKTKKKEAVEGDEKPATAAVKDDPTGVYPNVTADSPPFQIVKFQRFGKFVVAYCQINNKTENGKRITVANFFKDRDNQDLIPPRTTVSFPYEHFSTKVKDLIADQSVRNLTPDNEEIPGLKYLNFVSVGECNTEDVAQRVAKVYIKVTYSDGTNFDATFNNNIPLPKTTLNIK